LGCSAASTLAFAVLLREDSSVALVVGLLVFQSLGTGLFNSPNNSSIMSAVERSRYGVIAALTNLTRNSANVVSVALATTIVVTIMAWQGVEPSLEAVSPQVAGAFVAGLRWAFLFQGALLLVGVVVTIFKGDRPREAPEVATPVGAGEAVAPR
jgi:hypothetical protein